jgi:hypothetical protein
MGGTVEERGSVDSVDGRLGGGTVGGYSCIEKAKNNEIESNPS